MSTSGTNPEEPNQKKGPGQPATPRGSLPVPKIKRGLKGFLSDVGREMKKVSWPTKQETNRLTGVVLAVCLMIVAFLSVLGFVFELVINLLTKGTV